MTLPLPNRYPLDLTGTASTNLIVGEVTPMVRKQFRCIAPLATPFFKKNLVIKDVASNTSLTTSQYKCLQIVSLPSAMAGIGNEIYSIIVITDSSVSDTVSLTYHTPGGEYTNSFETTKSLVENLLGDNRLASWPNVLNRPDTFEPSLHLQAIGDLIGFEYLTVELEKLRQVILLGDDVGRTELFKFIETQKTIILNLLQNNNSNSSPLANHIANRNNPHGLTKVDVGLGNVQNYPVATIQEAAEGIATNRYITADLVPVAVGGPGNAGLGNHITDYTNPHQTTASQVGLGNVQNYPVATALDINNPIPGTQKYVTNIILKTYLDSFFTVFGADLTAEVAYVKTQADTALANSITAKTTAQTALTSIGTAVTDSSAAAANATAAKMLAQNNNAAEAASVTAGIAAVATFEANLQNEIINANTIAYGNGYTTGVAAGTISGYNNGYSAGNTVGYTSGYTVGYNGGLVAGRQEILTADYATGSNVGYFVGVNGYASGFQNTKTGNASFNSGYDAGYSQGVAYRLANP
jgi:hypothetical protein